MVTNDIEFDVKMKFIEEELNQTSLGERIGVSGQYVGKTMRKEVVNKTFVKMMEGFGYDITLVYTKRID